MFREHLPALLCIFRNESFIFENGRCNSARHFGGPVKSSSVWHQLLNFRWDFLAHPIALVALVISLFWDTKHPSRKPAAPKSWIMSTMSSQWSKRWNSEPLPLTFHREHESDPSSIILSDQLKEHSWMGSSSAPQRQRPKVHISHR